MSLDKLISEVFYEEGKPFRIINGKKVYQFEDIKTDYEERHQRAINRIFASGLSSLNYLKNQDY